MMLKFCVLLLLLHMATALLGYNKFPGKFHQSGDSSSSEEVVCSISSVDYPAEDKMFSRYILPSIQMPYAAWVVPGNSFDFEGCSEEASRSGARMFYFHDGLCKISKDQYYRLTLDINCGEPGGIAVVYVLDDLPDNLFEGMYSYRTDVAGYFEVFPSCNVNYTTRVTDNHTIINTFDYETVLNCYIERSDVYFGEISDDYVLTWSTNSYHQDQRSTCAAINMTTCAPKTEESRARFIQETADFFDNAQLNTRYIILDLVADMTSYREWVWGTGVIQPDTKSTEGWDDSEPFGSPWDYGFHLLNGGLYSWFNNENGVYYHMCCSLPKIEYDVSAYMLF